MAKRMYQPHDEEEKYRQLREQARAEGSDIFRTRRGNSTLYVLEGAGWFSVSTTDWKETRCYKADLKTGYFDADRYSDTARFYLDNGLLEVD